MDLNYYHEFVTLMEVRNFTKAADELYITQSSLSKHIRALEDEVGAQLVDRNGKEAGPTPIGEIFLKHARTICSIQRNCADEIERYLKQSSEQIRIVGIRAMIEYGVEDKIFEFGNHHPMTKIDVENYTESLIPALISNGASDIGLIRQYYLNDDSILQSEILIEDQICVVLPPEHPLADRKKVSLKELKDETFFRRQEDNTVQKISEKAAENIGVHLKYAPLSIRTGFRSCLPYVKRGYGILLCARKPAIVDIEEAGLDLRVVELEEEIPINLCMVHRLNDEDHPILRELIEFMKKGYRRKN